MAYSGFYKPSNPNKYRGDPSKIVFRSSWELKVFEWCDTNPIVKTWASEEFYIPYICPTDGKEHRYFIDVLVEYTNGKVVLIEIKPDTQTRPPVKTARKNEARYLLEAATYAKNDAKWRSALAFCQKRGWGFQIWTEKTLDKMGIKTTINRFPRKKK